MAFEPILGVASTQRPQLFLLVWLVVALACEPSADAGLPEGVAFLEQDSAGVLVATTLGARARTPIGWAVDGVPEYQIGEAEGEAPYLFSRIQGARQLSDGRVVVLDGASCEFRFFDADGMFLKSSGGRGEGPGELNAASAATCLFVSSRVSDSLHAFDGAGVSVFDDRGRFHRRMPISWTGKRVVAVVGIADEKVLVESRFSPYAQEGGFSRKPATVDYALLESGSPRPVWESSFQGLGLYVDKASSGGIDALYMLPFDVPPDAALGSDGFFLTLGENQSPEVFGYDFSGRLRRIFRLAEPVAEPTKEHLDKLVEFDFERGRVPESTRVRIRERVRRRYREMPLPETMPVISRLIVDDSGWLWAALYRFDVRQPARWLVFGPNGEGMGSVDMPPGLHVWQIGRDFVMGVWHDDNEVEYVRRHALTRRLAGSS